MNSCRVPVTAALRRSIQERISRFEEEAPEALRWLAPYVRRHGVLPCTIGWLETVGITPDGQVLKFSADGERFEYEELREPESWGEFANALVQAAQRYPDLAAMVPQIPAGATACTHCRELPFQNRSFICVCGNIGWVPCDAR